MLSVCCSKWAFQLGWQWQLLHIQARRVVWILPSACVTSLQCSWLSVELLLIYFSATEERVWPSLSVFMEESLENSVCSCLKCRRNSSVAEGKHASQDCSQQLRCYGTPSSGCSENAWKFGTLPTVPGGPRHAKVFMLNDFSIQLRPRGTSGETGWRRRNSGWESETI